MAAPVFLSRIFAKLVIRFHSFLTKQTLLTVGRLLKGFVLFIFSKNPAHDPYQN